LEITSCICAQVVAANVVVVGVCALQVVVGVRALQVVAGVGALRVVVGVGALDPVDSCRAGRVAPGSGSKFTNTVSQQLARY
jgi:hypothetical protein